MPLRFCCTVTKTHLANRATVTKENGDKNKENHSRGGSRGIGGKQSIVRDKFTQIFETTTGQQRRSCHIDSTTIGHNPNLCQFGMRLMWAVWLNSLSQLSPVAPALWPQPFPASLTSKFPPQPSGLWPSHLPSGLWTSHLSQTIISQTSAPCPYPLAGAVYTHSYQLCGPVPLAPAPASLISNASALWPSHLPSALWPSHIPQPLVFKASATCRPSFLFHSHFGTLAQYFPGLCPLTRAFFS